MKRDRLLLIAVLSISIIASNCSKGPMGPQGEQGPPGATGANGSPGSQGPKGDSGVAGSNGSNGANGSDGADGAQGPPGSANVIYSNWISDDDLDVTWHDSVLVTGTLSVALEHAPDITQAVIDSGIVLCYVSGVSILSPSLLPFSTDGYILNFAPLKGDLLLYIDDPITHNTSGAVPTPDWQYRYVIIPGGIPASGRRIDPRKMTYEQVCKTYNIPQ